MTRIEIIMAGDGLVAEVNEQELAALLQAIEKGDNWLHINGSEQKQYLIQASQIQTIRIHKET